MINPQNNEELYNISIVVTNSKGEGVLYYKSSNSTKKEVDDLQNHLFSKHPRND